MEWLRPKDDHVTCLRSFWQLREAVLVPGGEPWDGGGVRRRRTEAPSSPPTVSRWRQREKREFLSGFLARWFHMHFLLCFSQSMSPAP